jgi:ribosomal-protein-alanine N-acetyltransferase
VISTREVSHPEQRPLRIRQAEWGDLDRIVQIEHASFPTPWPRELLGRYLGEEGFLVAESEGGLIGYLIVGLKMASFFARLERRTRQLLRGEAIPEPQIGHVLNIAIDPRYRRRGLGAALLQRGLEYLTRLGAEEIELEVRVDNAAAIALYRRFGFSIKERLRNYYSNGDDAFLMGLRSPVSASSDSLSGLE